MATLIFSTVGTAFGGPIGGMIGSLVGQGVDTAIFGSDRREGPRLQELQVTASTYGQPLPRHFGAMRVAGSIIWATDLIEHSETQGGGKGAPAVTTYSYTANLAVALASRPILGIGRIWADGKLLRGAEGDLKVGGTMRLYTGEGDQPPDPLIAASEGASLCPAYRGLAYVVFEDLDLSEYYNRLPAMTFEVLADESFNLQDVVGELVDAIDAQVPLDGITGYTADGPVAQSIETFDLVIPLSVSGNGEALAISHESRGESPVPLPAAAISVEDGDFGGPLGFTRHRLPASQHPVRCLRYFDAARDYLPGIQYASGSPPPGQPRSIELPAALDAEKARTLIERASRRIDWTRERMAWRSCELDPAIVPGSTVSVPGVAGAWRVAEWEWRASGVELSLERLPPPGAIGTPGLKADSGRANLPADLPTASTELVAFELPLGTANGNADTPHAFVAVSAGSSNWSGAALYADRGDGEMLPLGPSGRTRSTIGTAATRLEPGHPLLFDRERSVEVTLVDPAMSLSPASLRQMAQGANLALLGEEIVQFAKALPLGEGRWELSGFLRGRGGTERAMADHAVGERFVLLDSRLVALDASTLGASDSRQVLAIGRGDSEPAPASILLAGITLRPLAPVHPRHAIRSDGSLHLAWTRRARGAWPWQDGVDVPLVEEAERYLVTLGPLDAPAASWHTQTPELAIAPNVLAQLSAAYPAQPLHVRQQGTHALSAPLLLRPVS